MNSRRCYRKENGGAESQDCSRGKRLLIQASAIMGNPKAFMKIPRKEAGYRLISERIYDHGEVEQMLNREDRKYKHHDVWTVAFLSPLGLPS